MADAPSAAVIKLLIAQTALASALDPAAVVADLSGWVIGAPPQGWNLWSRAC